jgi:hypothetical protein
VVSVEVTEGYEDVVCKKTLKSANLEFRICYEAPGRGFEEFACLQPLGVRRNRGDSVSKAFFIVQCR